MKVERDVVLSCSVCGVEGPHELLYLSGRLNASRCMGCGTTLAYSGPVYAGYALDVAGRTVRLSGRVVGRAVGGVAGALRLPVRAARKPFGLLGEAYRVAAFERRTRRTRRRAPAGGL